MSRPSKSVRRDQRLVEYLTGRSGRARETIAAVLGLSPYDVDNAVRRLRRAGLIAEPSDGLVRLAARP